MIKKRANS